MDAFFEVRNTLSQNDLIALRYIYMCRCLTLKQFYYSFFRKDISTFNKFMDVKLKEFLRLNLVTEVVVGDSIVLFLTKHGIEVLKEFFKFPSEVYDHKTKKIIKGCYTSSQLKIENRLIPHQIYLNQFLLDFKEIYEHRKMVFKWEYFDEKHTSSYYTIRPDGILSLLGTDLFLEMDMSTESKKQLMGKWEHYRSFLSKSNIKHSKKKIIVLFIIANTTNIENRKNIVKLTASQMLLDLFEDNFELIVGTKDELLRKLFNNIIPTLQQTDYSIENLKSIITLNHGFNITNAYPLRKQLNGGAYEFYIRKLDENNNVKKEDGASQEYLLDYELLDNMQVINKISYLDSNSNTFKYFFKREIRYIVVVNDLDKLLKELELFNLVTEKNVFYTTLNRLKTMKFEEALIQFDSNLNMYCFLDKKLSDRKYI